MTALSLGVLLFAATTEPAPSPAQEPAPPTPTPPSNTPLPASIPSTAAPMSSSPPRDGVPPPLGRSGRFGLGLHLDLFEFGLLQAAARGGSSGVLVGIGTEFDLGGHWAIRAPLQIGVAGGSGESSAERQGNSYVALTLAPALLYRFRSTGREHWVPYLGAALQLGVFQFGRHLLGLEPSPAGTAQAFVLVGAAPELLAGVLFSPSRLFSLRFGLDYSLLWVAHTSLHVFSESACARFSF